MKFAIQINSAPWHGGAGGTAYQFIRAAMGLGHEIVRVFFYADGVGHGQCRGESELGATPPQSLWSELAAEGVDLIVCVSAAHRRGGVDEQEIVPSDQPSPRLAKGFRIAGLGLWVDACLRADRVLVFGD